MGRSRSREEIIKQKKLDARLTRKENIENAITQYRQAVVEYKVSKTRGLPEEHLDALRRAADRAAYSLKDAIEAQRPGDPEYNPGTVAEAKDVLRQGNFLAGRPETPIIGEKAPWPALMNTLGIFQTLVTAALETKRQHLFDRDSSEVGSMGVDYVKNLGRHIWSPKARDSAGEQFRRLVHADPDSYDAEVSRTKEYKEVPIFQSLPHWLTTGAASTREDRRLNRGPIKQGLTEEKRTVRALPVSMGPVELGGVPEDLGAVGAELATLGTGSLGNIVGFPNRVVKGATGAGIGSHAWDLATKAALKTTDPGVMNWAVRTVDYLRPGGALRRVHLENKNIDPLAVWDDAVRAEVLGDQAGQRIANEYANTMRGMSVEDRALVVHVAEGSIPRSTVSPEIQRAADVMREWDKTIGLAHAKTLGYNPWGRRNVVMNPENLSDMTVPEGQLSYVRHAWSKAWEAEQKAKNLGLDPDFVLESAAPAPGPTPKFSAAVPEHRSWVDILNERLGLAPGQNPSGPIRMPGKNKVRLEQIHRAQAQQQGIPTVPLQDTVKDVNDFTRNWFGAEAFSADPATQAIYRIRQGGQIPFADLLRSWGSKYGQKRSYPGEPVLADPSNVGSVVPGMRTPMSSPAGVAARNPGQHSLWERLTRDLGMSDEVASGTTALPNAMADYIELHTRNQQPGFLLNAFSRLNQNWKALVTAPIPTYHLRNKMTNLGSRFMVDGASSFHPEVRDAVDAVKRGERFTLRGQMYDGSAVRKSAEEHGLLSAVDQTNPSALGDVVGMSPYEQVAGDALRWTRASQPNSWPWQKRWWNTQHMTPVNPGEFGTVRKMAENALFPRKWEVTRRMGNWGAQNIEESDRLSMMLSAMRDGMSEKDAMRLVDTHMFNRYRYPEWARNETRAGQISSAMIPFGGWQSSNFGRYGQLLGTKPQAVYDVAVLPEKVSAQMNLDDPQDRSQFLSGRWRGQLASGGPAIALGTSATGKPVVASNAFAAMAEPIDAVSALTSPWSFKMGNIGPANFITGPVLRRTSPLIANVGGSIINWDPQRGQKLVEHLQNPSGAVEETMTQAQQAGRQSALAHEAIWKLNDLFGGIPGMPADEKDYVPFLATRRAKGGDIMQQKTTSRFLDLFRSPVAPIGGFAESQAEIDPLTFALMSAAGMTPQVMDWDRMLQQNIGAQTDFRRQLGVQTKKLETPIWQQIDKFKR